MSEKIVVEDLSTDYSYNTEIVRMVRAAMIESIGLASGMYRATELESYDALFSAMEAIKASMLMLDAVTEEQLDGATERTKEITDQTLARLESTKDEFKKLRAERLNATKQNAQ